MRRSPAPAALVALLLVLLLSGCTGGSGEDAALSDTSAQIGDSDSAGGGGDSSGGAASGGEASSPDGAPAEPGEAATTSVASGRVAAGRSLIRTGELTVEVADVDDAADEAARLAVGAGGAVEAEERTSGGEDGSDRSAVVVLRVPPPTFDATLRRLAGLGEELDRRLGTQDVTDQVVDLDSRIATQRASVERVRALLAEADALGEVVQIESELTRRTADLESLEARLAVLDEQVDLATITVRLQGEDSSLRAAGGPLGFDDGLAAGWRALTAAARALGVTLGALLPFTPLLLVVGALLWRSRTRRAPAA